MTLEKEWKEEEGWARTGEIQAAPSHPPFCTDCDWAPRNCPSTTSLCRFPAPCTPSVQPYGSCYHFPSWHFLSCGCSLDLPCLSRCTFPTDWPPLLLCVCCCWCLAPFRLPLHHCAPLGHHNLSFCISFSTCTQDLDFSVSILPCCLACLPDSVAVLISQLPASITSAHSLTPSLCLPRALSVFWHHALTSPSFSASFLRLHCSLVLLLFSHFSSSCRGYRQQ